MQRRALTPSHPALPPRAELYYQISVEDQEDDAPIVKMPPLLEEQIALMAQGKAGAGAGAGPTSAGALGGSPGAKAAEAALSSGGGNGGGNSGTKTKPKSKGKGLKWGGLNKMLSTITEA